MCLLYGRLGSLVNQNVVAEQLPTVGFLPHFCSCQQVELIDSALGCDQCVVHLLLRCKCIIQPKEKPVNLDGLWVSGVTGGTRTPDPQLRRLLFYPTELRSQYGGPPVSRTRHQRIMSPLL